MWRCKINGSVEIDWKSFDASYVVFSSNYFSLKVTGRDFFFGDHLFSSAIGELMKEVKLPGVVPLRACINLEDGIVAVVYREPHSFWPGFLIALLACNVNELLCSYWSGSPPGLLAALITGEAARRAASKHPDPTTRSMLLELADSAERILTPIARFILGEEVDMKKLVDAMRGLAEIHNFLVTIFGSSSPRASFTILNKLKEALGEEDFQKLRKLLEGVVERSYLGSGPFRDSTYAYLRISRDGRNSLLPADAVGAILEVPLKSESEYESQHVLVLDAVDVGVRPYIYTFKSGEVLDIAAKAMKEMPFRSHVILYVVEQFDGKIDAFTDPSKEDVLRMIETYINAIIESYEKGGVASRTVRLGDGRKLHIIVSYEVRTDDMFKYSILLLSNHETKAAFLKDFIDLGYIRHDEDAVKYIASMREEDLAKLDDETLDAVLKLLFLRAFLSTLKQ